MSIVINEHKTKIATELDLVNWFLLKSPLSQKKIQKLAYYAQAWSLVFLDKDIVEGIKFQAWVHGPVNYRIRTELASSGWNELSLSNKDEVRKELKNKFTTEQEEVLEQVWKVYGKFSADQLEVLTHREKPWLEQREGLSIFEASQKTISNETMKEYYKGLAVE